ncbi:MAG TPA: hypothetical protein VFG21_07105, partial [Xanthomonadaceae bacterium]|nr:hypothetical protein [Xanthomonadaceae bacterium]
LRALMNLVARDVRRAGYDDLSLERVGTGTDGPADLSPHARMQIVGGDSGCVAFSYDRAGNTAGIREDSELRAFRRGTVSGIGVLQMRTGAGTSCDAGDGWDTLSDPNAVDIRRFGVVLSAVNAPIGPGSAPIRVRDLDLALEGNLLNAQDTVRAIQTRIRVRADCVREDLTECDSL